MHRRQFTQSLVALTAATGFGLHVGTSSASAAAFGPLLPPDANGLRLPVGFTSRIIATTGQPVAGTGYIWHPNPDGGATFPRPGGGWIYVSNDESGAGAGGVSAVEFDSTGAIIDARNILSGTTRNCAGGPMPWGTWLSCEETAFGQVWECDPSGVQMAVVRPAMGMFNHEAAAADPIAQVIYLTEDRSDGGLYRFTPTTWGDLSNGLLEVMTETAGTIGFAPVPDPTGQALPTPTETRFQVSTMKVFAGGEGAWFADGVLYFATKFDNRVWTYTPATNTLVAVYDGSAPGSILTGVDNLAAGPGGDVYVCEDGGDMEVVTLSPDGSVAPFLQITGAPNSEVTGVAFDPSGTRLYVSSQRNPGVTYEVTGPFGGAPTAASWGSFIALGAPDWDVGPQDGHSVVSNAAGVTALAALKASGDLFVNRSNDGLVWGSPVELRASGWASADAAIDDSGRVEIIGVTADGRLYTRSWLASGGFDPWVEHGLPTWDPSTKPSISTSGSRIVLGAVKADGRLYTRERSTAGSWGSFTEHGLATWTHVDIDQASDGSLWFVGSKSDGRLFTRFKAGGSWGPYSRHGLPTWDATIAPSITVEANNLATFAAIKTDGRLYTRGTTSSGGWTGFVRHGVNAWSGVSLDSDSAGHIALAATKDFGRLYTRRSGTSTWGSWTSHGLDTWSVDTAPSIAAGDGAPQFLAVKADGRLYTRIFT